MNSPRRTAPGSHPDSDAAFPFSPGGAARRPFLFFHLPPSPHGAVRAASLSPGRALRSRGFRGRRRGGRRSLRQSFQRSFRRGCPWAFRPSGPPVARPPAGPGGRWRFCRLFRRGNRFSRPVRHFPRPARRSPRPVHPVFPHISRLASRTAYRRLTPSMALHAPEAAGASSVSLMARRGRFPVAPDRPSPAACPGFFAPYI